MKKLLLTAMLLCLPFGAHAVNLIPAGYDYNLTSQNPSASQLGPDAKGNLNYKPLEPFSAFDARNGFGGSSGTGITQYIAGTYRTLVNLGLILGVVILTIGGLRYMLSNAFTDIDKAKRSMKNALWGAGLIAGSFLIAYTLNPDFLVFKLFQSNPVTPTSQQTTKPQDLGVPTQDDINDCVNIGKKIRWNINGTWECVPMNS